MSRKKKIGKNHWLRENHRSVCPRKIGHDTEAQAQAHIDSLVENRKAAGQELVIYRCLECCKLHVGHKLSVVGTEW